MTDQPRPFAIGIDFGTESGRAVLVDIRDGREVATAVHRYADGVIDHALPGSTVRLPPEWALQNPQDYVEVLKQAVPAVLRQARVDPAEVCGIGIDFTACTVLPVLVDGTPLCTLPDLHDNPHSWVKLWKHHAAQPQADRINELARQRNEPWLSRYGGKISSEWFFAKALQTFEEAPDVYARTERLIEAADWIVWQLTGRERRSACVAGYKAIHQDGDYPSRDFLAALHPGFADIVETRMSRDLLPLGARAGSLCPRAAAWTGLPEGLPVAVANVDAHVTLPATGDVSPGTLVAIMGTSTCHVMTGGELREVEGMCGVVDGGIVPGQFGYESGQSGVGDIFGWFVRNFASAALQARASAANKDLHVLLMEEAQRQAPGEHGLLALDWMNGNRSVLVDADLSGAILGLTLASTPADVYRALLEATVFGTRRIIESFETTGVPITRFVAAGGLPARNPLLMQLTADICKREVFMIRSEQGAAVGAAMHAAVAAGAWPDIATAAAHMGGLSERTYTPDPAASAVYDGLYKDYCWLHDLLGRSDVSSDSGVLKRLNALRRAASTAKTAGPPR